MKKIFFFIFLSGFLFAQKVYNLKGTIGTAPIFMHFEDYTSENDSDNRIVDVRYFYTSQLKDIVLSGEKNGNTFNLRLENSINDQLLEKMVITVSGNDNFEGTWTNGKGKNFPVSLKKIDLDSLKNPFLESKFLQNLKKEDPYNFARSCFFKFTKTKTEKKLGGEFDWYQENFSKTNLFRLSKNFEAKSKKIINQNLFDLHLQNSIDQLSCSTSFDYSDGKGIESSFEITFLDKNLLGFEISDSFFCGGAHPDFGSEGFLYDLNSGKSYEIDDIIVFDKSATTEKVSGFNDFSKYRGDFFSKELVRLMKKQHHFEKPKDEDNCDYTDNDVWTFPSWSFSKEGIYFTPEFATVVRSCEEPYLLPFSVLAKYKNPKFPYSFSNVKKQ